MRYKIHDAGYWMLDAGYKIQDAGLKDSNRGRYRDRNRDSVFVIMENWMRERNCGLERQIWQIKDRRKPFFRPSAVCGPWSILRTLEHESLRTRERTKMYDVRRKF